jgi:hypothetical protein
MTRLMIAVAMLLASQVALLASQGAIWLELGKLNDKLDRIVMTTEEAPK